MASLLMWNRFSTPSLKFDDIMVEKSKPQWSPKITHASPQSSLMLTEFYGTTNHKNSDLILLSRYTKTIAATIAT